VSPDVNPDAQLLDYVLRLADSDLVLAQRLGEWIGHGPVLEEDIALTNVGLDLLGQARLWYAYAGEVETRLCGRGRSEDELAFLRDSGAYRSYLLVEQPNGNYADTMARQFYFDAAHRLLLGRLTHSGDARVAEVAAKSLKEVAYHVERSADWIVRLGDGTEESHRRTQAAVDALWMYTGEMFEACPGDDSLVADGVVPEAAALLPAWKEYVTAVFAEATLSVPDGRWMQRGGTRGVHSEHLGRILAEMQFLQRAYPQSQW
jgi:ring-1,2-phenylacetyl-CoA epoxidase subunit PaaC